MSEKCFCHVRNKKTGECYQVKDAVARQSTESLQTQVTSLLNVVDSKFSTYIFEQAVPSATWEITHNLNKNPSVTVVDSAGTVVLGDVVYIDTNTIRIMFSGEFNGKAYLN